MQPHTEQRLRTTHDTPRQLPWTPVLRDAKRRTTCIHHGLIVGPGESAITIGRRANVELRRHTACERRHSASAQVARAYLQSTRQAFVDDIGDFSLAGEEVLSNIRHGSTNNLPVSS